MEDEGEQERRTNRVGQREGRGKRKWKMKGEQERGMKGRGDQREGRGKRRWKMKEGKKKRKMKESRREKDE